MIVVAGGATARFSIEVYDSSDVAVTGLVNGGFSKFLSTNGATDATAVTVTEVASGEYTVTFVAPAVAAGSRSLCRCRVTHTTYAKRGWAQTFLVVNADVLAGVIQTGDAIVAKNILEGDETIDKTVTPWNQVIKLKSTATELVRKKLRKSDGTTGIDEDSDIVGSRTEA